MDKKADKLKLVDVKENLTSKALNQTTSEDHPMEPAAGSTTVTPPGSTLWQRWNRTEFLARIIDDILKPAHERITLVFQTLVPRDGAGGLNEKPVTEDDSSILSDQPLNATSDSEELNSDVELEPSDPPANDTTLLGQFQARRMVLRRRVAKALSSITGLLILAANSRREAGKPRSVRSTDLDTYDEGVLLDERQHLLHLPNEIESHKDGWPVYEELEYNGKFAESDSDEETPRRNMESIGIFLLEVFGSIAGFSWGIFKQVQSFLW
uniref:Uncharacterized protein n=1 Tax=Anopheles dirus TaxID=7168 RepID=A0A182NWJ0_9DIPT